MPSFEAQFESEMAHIGERPGGACRAGWGVGGSKNQQDLRSVLLLARPMPLQAGGGGRRILRPYGRAADPGTVRGHSAREIP